MRDALSSRKPPKSKGMEWDGLLEWWDQGCGGFTPITSQHSDLSLICPDLDVGMSPDGIKPPQVPISCPCGWDSTGGWMRMGSSSQPHKHPRRWQDLPSTNHLKRSFIGQFKDSKQSCSPAGTSAAFPRCRTAPCPSDIPEKQEEEEEGGAMPGHGILR